MATTFNFEVNNKPSKKGLYSVMIRITQDRKIKRVKTLVELSNLNYWDKANQRVKSTCANYKKINTMLAAEMERAKGKYIELRESDQALAENVINSIKGKYSASLIQFLADEIETMKKDGRLGNAKTYNNLYIKLVAFAKTQKQGDIYFNDITSSSLVAFREFLRITPSDRNNRLRLHPNTVTKILARYRAVYNKAKQLKLVVGGENPFDAITFSIVPTSKDKLNNEEVQSIIRLDIDEGSLLWHCRNTFLFSMYCAGIRISDLLQIRWKNIDDNRIVYSMDKNNKNRDLVLIPQAIGILEYYRNQPHKPNDYIFPFLDSKAKYAKYVTFGSRETMPIKELRALKDRISTETAKINKGLKEIQRRTGINKNITNHIARHTFAKLAKEAGIDNLAVKGLLAHSSISTTERYMGSFASEQEDNALRGVFHANDKRQQLLDICRRLSDEEIGEIIEFIKQR